MVSKVWKFFVKIGEYVVAFFWLISVIINIVFFYNEDDKPDEPITEDYDNPMDI